jgi:N-methylhydantoinase B
VQHELRCDAAGPGEFRGGSGADYHVIVEEEAEYAFRGEGQRTPSGYGVHGGGMGAAGRVTFRIDGAPWTPPQFGTGRVGPTEIRIQSPAGGGWGDPKQRDPQLVLLDVRNGIIGEEAARCVYGVAIASDGRSVDVEATCKLRGE